MDEPCAVTAITTSVVTEIGGWQRPQVALYTDYLGTLDRNGLVGLLLTPGHSHRGLDALLDRCHGLVLSGGEDVDPSRYGEDPIPELGEVNAKRDAMEFYVLEKALERGLPVLGICRGLQLLNVFFGGTLYQDIDTQRSEPGRYGHQQGEWYKRSHQVEIYDDSILCEISGCGDVMVNSFHHQAVKDLGSGLKITARADDGMVEGIETADGRWVVAVQWHPERHEATAPHTDPDRRILAGFRQAVLDNAGQPA